MRAFRILESRTVAVVAVATVMVAGACGTRARPSSTAHPFPVPPVTAPPTTMVTSTTASAPRVAVAGVRLTPFSSCDQLLAYARSEAAAEVTPYGLAWPYPWLNEPMMRFAAGPMAAMGVAGPMAPVGGSAGAGSAASGSGATTESASSAPPASPTFSTTNDQEAGVDEPDTVKTDGHVLVTLRAGGQILQAVDVRGTPRLAGSVDLGEPATGLFLVGNDVVVIAPGQPRPLPQPPPPPQQQQPSPQQQQPSPQQQQPSPQQQPLPVPPTPRPRQTTQLIVVDTTDPDHLAVVRSFSVDGSEVAARLIGHSIKLVVTSGPTIGFSAPGDGSPASSARALAANRAAIAGSTLGDWLPSVTDAVGVTHRAACGSVDHATQPEGLQTVSVVTIDPDQSGSGQAVTVLADAQNVYASTDNLYVASMAMPPVVNGVLSPPAPSAERTVIHAFAINGPGAARYLGSGEVPGTLLSQYSLSEYAGDLRVATTLGIPTPPPGEGGPVPAGAGAADQPGASQSFVTVVRLEGRSLVPVGQVAGLGRGQKIFAVRFLGALGYVVTFRQLDPLYVVDLSDPQHPAVRGALELSGYSAYLHPLDATHLLGIGGSADANGRRTGLQLTVFDVHDPAQPEKIAQASIANGSSAAEQDPHAMLWWSPASLAVIPVMSYDPASGTQFGGAIGYRIGGGQGITEAGRILPPGETSTPACPPRPGVQANGGDACARYAWSPIERDVVVGTELLSFSPTGIVISDLATLQRSASLIY